MQTVSISKIERKAESRIATVDMPDGSTYPIKRLTGRPDKLNAKLAKNGESYLTIPLTLAPHKASGIGNLCSFATTPCIDGCLNRSGMATADSSVTDHIMAGRIARARLYFQDRSQFLAMYRRELSNALRLAKKNGLKAISRPNVLSDIDWAKTHRDLILEFPDIMFYGYTKNPYAMMRFIDGQYPSNYYLTFSRSDKNENKCLEILGRGGNVTVIFDTKYSGRSKHPLPSSWKGFPVIDGDETDLRFLDPKGVVVGLRAKGLLRRPENQDTGFVVKISTL